MRIGYVTNSPAPYRIQQFNKLCEIEGLSFTIYYTKKDSRRDWKIEKSIAEECYLKGFEPLRLQNRDCCINFGLLKIVRAHDLILIGGYEQITYLLLSMLCKMMHKKYILVFDGIQPQKIVTEPTLLKKAVISFIVKNACSIFGNGIVSKLYFMKKYNYDGNKIFNQYLTSGADEINQMYPDKAVIRSKMRKRYAVSSDKFVILYVGRLIKLKNVELIVKSLGLLKEKDACELLIVGDGPERANLELLSKELNVSTCFTGNLSDPKEVYRHYMAADLFVFPTTHEAWGLVISEAMAAGLPILCSVGAGASIDLVKEGINGFTFDFNDVEELSQKIKFILDDEVTRKSFGNASRSIIRDWTLENSKESFIEMMIKNRVME